MKIAAVISEYNPFHLGHSYHLAEVKKTASPDGIICIMSGNFVQRGEPAFVNKWARAEMALSQGADLVLELPVLYAVRSAYWFARGSIESLQRTGVVTHLAFGVENNNLDEFTTIAQNLVNETPGFKTRLKLALKEGFSYPRARARALEYELNDSSPIWSSPNNILGLTYLQILLERNIPIQPLLIKRTGAGYLQQHLSEEVLPSASAIRRYLFNQHGSYLDALAEIQNYLPPAVYPILSKEFSAGRGPISFQNLTLPVMSLLRRSTAHDLQRIIDVSEGLENRFLKAAQEAVDLRGFLEMVKTKRFTYTRLQRFLVHLFLNYTLEKEAFLNQGPPYLRILGFTSRGKQILKKIKTTTTIPIITKGAHSRKYCLQEKAFRTFWEMDVLATNLYTLLYPLSTSRKGNQDYFIDPVQR